MDDGVFSRAQERVAERADGAALEALVMRAREQVDALAALEDSLPTRVEDAVRGQAEPVGRNLAELRGLMNQVLRRLERLESDLLVERNGRVDDLALLVELISSGWKNVDARLAGLEQSIQTDRGAVIYRIEDRRPDAATS
jgi:hypothetical protein